MMTNYLISQRQSYPIGDLRSLPPEDNSLAALDLITMNHTETMIGGGSSNISTEAIISPNTNVKGKAIKARSMSLRQPNQRNYH